MRITFPSNTTEIIDQIREAIGRPVTFVLESGVPCQVCGGIDPNTGFAADPFCPTCSGLGYIPTYTGVQVLAHITWGGVDSRDWERGGAVISGDCRIQIKYTPANETLVNRAKYVIIDSRRTKKIRVIKRGVQGINRILVDCALDELEGG